MENRIDSQQYNAPMRPTAMPIDGTYDMNAFIVVVVPLFQ